MENWYYMLKYDEDKRKNLTFCWRTKKAGSYADDVVKVVHN